MRHVLPALPHHTITVFGIPWTRRLQRSHCSVWGGDEACAGGKALPSACIAPTQVFESSPKFGFSRDLQMLQVGVECMQTRQRAPQGSTGVGAEPPFPAGTQRAASRRAGPGASAQASRRRGADLLPSLEATNSRLRRDTRAGVHRTRDDRHAPAVSPTRRDRRLEAGISRPRRLRARLGPLPREPAPPATPKLPALGV